MRENIPSDGETTLYFRDGLVSPTIRTSGVLMATTTAAAAAATASATLTTTGTTFRMAIIPTTTTTVDSAMPFQGRG